MAPRKTGFDMLLAESRERNDVSRKIALSASKEPENSARIVTGISGSQGVESNSVDLARDEKPLNELSVEEQILRLIGEISDDECDSSSISNGRVPVVTKPSALSRKRRFSELVNGTSENYVKGASKPKKESGLAREWRLIGIDVDVQHRRHQKLTGPSGASYKSFFSVDPFQLKDFDTVWESFYSREVSSGISDYRPKNCQ